MALEKYIVWIVKDMPKSTEQEEEARGHRAFNVIILWPLSIFMLLGWFLIGSYMQFLIRGFPIGAACFLFAMYGSIPLYIQHQLILIIIKIYKGKVDAYQLMLNRFKEMEDEEAAHPGDEEAFAWASKYKIVSGKDKIREMFHDAYEMNKQSRPIFDGMSGLNLGQTK